MVEKPSERPAPAGRVISSTSNPFVKRLRKLRHRRFREAEGVFLVEGIAQVRRALEHGAPVETIFVAPELLTSDGGWSAVEDFRSSGGAVVELGRAAFESVVEREHPSGLGATVRMVERSLTDLVARPEALFAAMHEVGNPGNLGSIIRAADAVGAGGVVVVGESTDQHHPAAVKASMGTLFSVPVCRAADVESLVAWCLMEKVTLVTTSAHAEESLWDADLPAPALYLFGSEAEGLPPEVLARGLPVRIPMEGSASSLNLAVAAGIVLFEAKRRSRKRD